MPHKKMIQPLSDALAGSEQDRFKRFAKALLAVPKSEVTPIEKTLAKLESDNRKIDAKLVVVVFTLPIIGQTTQTESGKRPGRQPPH